MIVVIGVAYGKYCDSGDKGAYCINVTVVIGELSVITLTVAIGEVTVITVNVVIGEAYFSYCESCNRGRLVSLLG